MNKEIEIPEGYEARIKGNKVILERKNSDDERIRKEIISALKFANDSGVYDKHIAYLEKQKINTEGDFGRGYDCGYEACLNSHGAELSEEDEKIRKALIDLIGVVDETYLDYYLQMPEPRNKMIAYLEKQKEKNTLSTEETELNSIAFLELLGYTCVPPGEEQKPLMSDGEIEDRKRAIVSAIRKYYSADYAEYLTSFLKGLSPEDNSDDEYGQEMLGIAYRLMYEHIPENLRTQEFWDCLKFMREYTGKVAIIHSYEKPAEWSDEDREMIQSIITNGCVDDKQERWLRMLPERICPPKQEWSEEDEDYLTSMKCAVYDYFDEGYAEELYSWLKFLPERFNLSPKQEWSEEDKDYYDAIIAKIEVTQDDAMLTDNQIDFLKSLPERFNLQPKQECSEEEIINWLKENFYVSSFDNTKIVTKFSSMDDLIKSVRKRLKSLRPQSKQESEPIEIKYAGKIYKVYGTKELPCGVVGYIIEDEPGHYDCIINPDEVLGGGYGIKSNGSFYPTKEANFGQPHWKPSDEQIDILDKVYHYLWVDRNATADMQDGLGDFIDELKSL